jgi:SAM-dependent methyltransferase
MAVEPDNLALARQFVSAVERGASDEVAALLAEDMLQEEFPNLLMPQGATRDKAAILAAGERRPGGAAGANLEVRQAAIREAEIEPDSFDLAHARFVLIHVPDWKGALATMIRCLKQGGWLVLEEPDFFSSRSLAGPAGLRRAFDNVHRAIEAMFRQRGLDHAFGARLPALLLDGGLERIAIENDAPIVPGGSPLARMMALSTHELGDKYIATGLATLRDIELYGSFAADRACWATYHATVRASGCKPGAVA